MLCRLAPAVFHAPIKSRKYQATRIPSTTAVGFLPRMKIVPRRSTQKVASLAITIGCKITRAIAGMLNASQSSTMLAARLQRFIEENLRGIKVLKLGRIQKTIYVAGMSPDNKLLGVKMDAVET